MSTQLSAQAYSKLRALILDGSLPSGTSLSERGLAETLVMGRMPVREAIRELAKEGLVATSPSRGTFVRQLGISELRDLYEARQAVEGMAAFLATKRGPTPRLLAFRGKFEDILEGRVQADLRGMQEIGNTFHLAIVEAAQNKELARIVDSLQAQVTLSMRMATESNPDRIPISLKEHLSILAAIEARDAVEAQRRMVAHLASALDARTYLFGAEENIRI
jgi:DNA-binding GntR family transcriptional regulator